MALPCPDVTVGTVEEKVDRIGILSEEASRTREAQVEEARLGLWILVLGRIQTLLL